MGKFNVGDKKKQTGEYDWKQLTESQYYRLIWTRV
ncbi:unnamed protein product [Paramecium octaurelia]|uniref:Uncharacterized protein n=1 Tax=Paramecium octaurelia TaxID=43137 RepID=A0A8S1Y9U8_PAROT|nr:unnamed protein product [Paramecium octaurelia]